MKNEELLVFKELVGQWRARALITARRIRHFIKTGGRE